MPFYSIIIPTFNSEKTLKKSLNSILSQTFQDYEILLIDGISTDSTIDIIKYYSLRHSNIRWISERDTGVYDAMNKGVNLSKGKWLYFLGSDDELYDSYVLNDVASQLNHQPECEIIYGNAFFIKSKIVWHGRFSISRLLLERNICHQAIFYQAIIFKKLGYFNLAYKVCADWDFNIRCFMHTEIVINYYNRIIANYEDGSGVSYSTDDPDFFKLIPVKYIRQLESVKTEITLLKQSKALKIGTLLLKPFKFFISLC